MIKVSSYEPLCAHNTFSNTDLWLLYLRELSELNILKDSTNCNRNPSYRTSVSYSVCEEIHTYGPPSFLG